MQSKTLQNVSVNITDETDLITHDKPITVKFSINKEETVADVEKVPPRKRERDRSVSVLESDNGPNVTYLPKAKKIHLWWFMTSDTIKAPVAELRNEMLAAFDKAIAELQKCDI